MNYLEILLDALRCDGFGDHNHVSLDVEADQDLAKNAGRGRESIRSSHQNITDPYESNKRKKQPRL